MRRLSRSRRGLQTRLAHVSIKKPIGIGLLLTSLLVALTRGFGGLSQMRIKRRRAFAHIVAILAIIIIILVVLIILTI